MSNQWNERDLLRLTRDCELGTRDALLHVVKTDGPYMTVHRHADGAVMHTGRDYAFATKIGEGAIDDAPLLSEVNDVLVDCEARLREVACHMRKIPTTRNIGMRLSVTCDRLEKIAEELAAGDHTGDR